MGICFTARGLSDEKIRAILADPPLVWRVIAPEEEEWYLEARGHSGKHGLLSRLLGGKRESPATVPSFEFSDAEYEEVDIDKSWDGINFCLKKLIKPGECPNLFEDGRPVGDVDVGYGPAMCFESQEVARIADRLAAISESDLLAQFAPSEMKRVYLADLWHRDDDDCRAYLTDNYIALKEFIIQARDNRVGILIQYT